MWHIRKSTNHHNYFSFTEDILPYNIFDLQRSVIVLTAKIHKRINSKTFLENLSMAEHCLKRDTMADLNLSTIKVIPCYSRVELRTFKHFSFLSPFVFSYSAENTYTPHSACGFLKYSVRLSSPWRFYTAALRVQVITSAYIYSLSPRAAEGCQQKDGPRSLRCVPGPGRCREAAGRSELTGSTVRLQNKWRMRSTKCALNV